MAYQNVAKFYKALGRDEDETDYSMFWACWRYFHLKGRIERRIERNKIKFMTSSDNS